MPAGSHPDRLALATVKKTTWRNNHLTKGKIRKLWDESAGLGKSREPSQYALRSLPEPDSCLWMIPRNKGHRVEKLDSS
jgi:hypothetical protein